MNYLHLGAYERAGEGASSRSCHIERDNQVITDLARRTGVIKAGEKASTCREWRSASFSAQETSMANRQLRAHKNLCADVISVGSDFSYTYFPFIVLAFRDFSSLRTSFLAFHPGTVRNPVRGYAESAEDLRTTDYADVTDKRTLTTEGNEGSEEKHFGSGKRQSLFFFVVSC